METLKENVDRVEAEVAEQRRMTIERIFRDASKALRPPPAQPAPAPHPRCEHCHPELLAGGVSPEVIRTMNAEIRATLLAVQAKAKLSPVLDEHDQIELDEVFEMVLEEFPVEPGQGSEHG